MSGPPATGMIARLECVARLGEREIILASRDLTAADLGADGIYREHVLAYFHPGFTLLGDKAQLGARLVYAGEGELSVDWVAWEA